MPWGRLDDSLYDHPKLDKLGRHRLACIGLNTLAQSWCNRWLTDGAVPSDRVPRLGGTIAQADLLVAAGLWERTDDGYRIHDFLDYNDSREMVLEKRGSARERMREKRTNRSRSSGEVPTNITRSSGDVQAPRGRVTRPVPSRPVPSIVSTGESDNGFDMDLWVKVQRLGEELTGITHALPNPYSGHGAQSLSQAGAVPWQTFEAAYRQIATVYGRPTARQLVFDAEDILRPTGQAAAGKAAQSDPEWIKAQVAELRKARTTHA